MKYQRLRMLVRLTTCILILLAAAVQRNHTILGHALDETESSEQEDMPIQTDANSIIVNTATIAKNIKGYGGPVPLEITIDNGAITKIDALKNAESSEFFGRVQSELIPKWIGTNVKEVSSTEIDAVTGATLSSNAVNATIKEGVAYALGNTSVNAKTTSEPTGFSNKSITITALLVVLCAAIVPLFTKNKYYRYAQLCLNAVVLGFWSGTFLSYELFINFLSNGINIWPSIVAIIMLIVAFAYPYFGKKSHYCMWICPLGSLQELAGKSVKYKWRISPKAVKTLSAFQEYLWLALIFVMIAGIWSDWIGYELFKAFIFRSATTGVIAAAIIAVLLSFVVQRPYCRFICPTGYLFQITQNTDK